MVKIFKPILLVFIKSKAMKRLIIDLLKAIAKQTDNTIDDQAVAFIESRMFQVLQQIFNDMKDDGFMNMVFSKLPVETELAVELRCREVMACKDTDRIKAFCIDLMKNHAKSEVVLSNAMMRMLELEAKLAILQTPPIKNKLLYKLRLFMEKLKLIRKIKQHQKNHSQRA